MAHEQTVGAPKQDAILLHEAEIWLPIFVSFTPSQKINTTRSTINEYSTNPWPFFSRSSLRNTGLLLRAYAGVSAPVTRQDGYERINGSPVSASFSNPRYLLTIDLKIYLHVSNDIFTGLLRYLGLVARKNSCFEVLMRFKTWCTRLILTF